MTNRDLISIVLPCRNQADHIGRIVPAYARALEATGVPFELVVVPKIDDSLLVASSWTGDAPGSPTTRAGSWISPPPPTTASTNPAASAASASSATSSHDRSATPAP